MAAIKIMQGDSYSIPFSITMNGSSAITPDMLSELELSVGNNNGVVIRKTFSTGEVWYDQAIEQWLFRPTQEETIKMIPGAYEVVARPKLNNGEYSDVIGVEVGRIAVAKGQSKEVI